MSANFTLEPIRANVLQVLQIDKEMHSLQEHVAQIEASIETSKCKINKINESLKEEAAQELAAEKASASAKELADKESNKGPRTSQFYRTAIPLPRRFEEPDIWNYKVKTQNPLYTTTANEYGGKRPTVHDMPTVFSGQSTKFSDHLNMAGPYRNFSLNV